MEPKCGLGTPGFSAALWPYPMCLLPEREGWIEGECQRKTSSTRNPPRPTHVPPHLNPLPQGEDLKCQPAWIPSSGPKVAGTIESLRDQVRLDPGSQAKKVQELKTRPSPGHPDRSDSEAEGSETFRRQHSSNGTSSRPLERPRHRNHPRSLRQGRDDECLRFAKCPGLNDESTNPLPTPLSSRPKRQRSRGI